MQMDSTDFQHGRMRWKDILARFARMKEGIFMKADGNRCAFFSY